jgi:2-polyprenyl-3-methyl-5-hydroxy-6-metoxy-1,4-benzoquinol methylase
MGKHKFYTQGETKGIEMNDSFEKTTCYLCKKEDDQPVFLKGKPITKGQFGYTAYPRICRGCGFIYLNPRWNKNKYNQFYKEHYDELYRLEIKPDYGIDGVVLHMKEIWKRIAASCDKRYIENIRNVLDVGCGSGYGLKYIKDQLGNVKIFGIESSPDCCETLQGKVGAKLITIDFDSDWTADYQGHFDLVIMRHVLEHALEPIETLMRLREVLSKNGILYIAVPDMMHPRTVLRDYDKWWEYWFRAIHLFYFCKETLFATLEKAGLYPKAYGEENEEVWCLASTDRSCKKYYEKNVYQKQIQILNKYLP